VELRVAAAFVAIKLSAQICASPLARNITKNTHPDRLTSSARRSTRRPTEICMGGNSLGQECLSLATLLLRMLVVVALVQVERSTLADTKVCMARQLRARRTSTLLIPRAREVPKERS